MFGRRWYDISTVKYEITPLELRLCYISQFIEREWNQSLILCWWIIINYYLEVAFMLKHYTDSEIILKFQLTLMSTCAHMSFCLTAESMNARFRGHLSKLDHFLIRWYAWHKNNIHSADTCITWSNDCFTN